MVSPGTNSRPVRIAVIGAGPAGFYAAEHFFKQKDLTVEVDLFDRLPTPHGLVRAGVAPDHQKIKNVTRVFDRTASNPAFRFFGNVEYGREVTLYDLKHFYHQIYFSTGAQVDRQLGIPGEDLSRSHSATEFVAWYNGHPDFRHLAFDLTQERVAIVGVGNVAVDVARILCKTADELSTTDMADYALEALAESRVREVYMIGRRGPAQAAFTLPEIKEMGTLEEASMETTEEDVTLDLLSQAQLESNPDRLVQKKLEILQSFVGGSRTDASRTCHIRFLTSPVELGAGPDGGVASMRVVRNRLVQSSSGRLSAQATDEFEDWPIGLVFRSVGYRGVALPGVPFNDAWGIANNDGGRVTDESGKVVPGLYVGGWYKRGPTGVIGTNKPDAVETVECMIQDIGNNRYFEARDATSEASLAFFRERQPNLVSYEDWKRLDELEIEAGAKLNRPRVKFTSVEAMLTALGRSA